MPFYILCPVVYGQRLPQRPSWKRQKSILMRLVVGCPGGAGGWLAASRIAIFAAGFGWLNAGTKTKNCPGQNLNPKCAYKGDFSR
jgi:hypothetical protein